MEWKERTYRTLVVSAAEKFNRSIEALLPRSRFCAPVIVPDAGSARRSLSQKDFDILLINTPLPDEFGTELATDLCSRTALGVLLLVRSESYEDIFSQVTPYGVLTVAKPTSAALFQQAMNLSCATRERMGRMEQKTASFQDKMQEIPLVSQAKLLLMEHRGLCEADAHRYIEKTAMDRCVKRLTVARDIIAQYS